MSKKCLDVAMIPRFGTDDSALWYGQYHALVRTVPHNGTDSTTQWYRRGKRGRICPAEPD
jgi:hypothetical protein